MTPAERKQHIETALTTHLAPSVLKVIDESHLHAGHAGAQGGASHFAVEIAAEAFEGKTRVAAHRMIYALFADLIPHEIHALRIVMVHPGYITSFPREGVLSSPRRRGPMDGTG